MENMVETVKVGDLVPGDLVDMSLILEELITEHGADVTESEREFAECELAPVTYVEDMGNGCVIVETEGAGGWGLPDSWLIDRCGHDESYC